MKIWLDDQYDDENTSSRAIPKGYVGAHSVNEVKSLIEDAESRGEEIEMLDLDNDLGDYSEDGGDGHKLLEWLIERETFYPINIHSMNTVEKENMIRTINRYWPR